MEKGRRLERINLLDKVGSGRREQACLFVKGAGEGKLWGKVDWRRSSHSRRKNSAVQSVAVTVVEHGVTTNLQFMCQYFGGAWPSAGWWAAAASL